MQSKAKEVTEYKGKTRRKENTHFKRRKEIKARGCNDEEIDSSDDNCIMSLHDSSTSIGEEDFSDLFNDEIHSEPIGFEIINLQVIANDSFTSIAEDLTNAFADTVNEGNEKTENEGDCTNEKKYAASDLY